MVPHFSWLDHGDVAAAPNVSYLVAPVPSSTPYAFQSMLRFNFATRLMLAMMFIVTMVALSIFAVTG